jgi:hypothetical protein
MKQMKKLISFLLVLVAFTAVSYAQVSADATATATIVSPITITKTVDMDFGNVAVSSVAGTVILTPAGTRSTTGGVTLPATTGTVTAAAFNVTGTPAYTYSIAITGSPLTVTSGANTMTVTAFTSTPASPGTLVAGDNALTVGATLNVGANQASGTYVSGLPFTVTVNYN